MSAVEKALANPDNASLRGFECYGLIASDLTLPRRGRWTLGNLILQPYLQLRVNPLLA